MPKQSTKTDFQRQGIDIELQAFLKSPPAGTPDCVLKLLGSTLDCDNRLIYPELFFEAVEQASVAISITDPKGIILYVNQSFEKTTGYDSMEVIGRNESMLGGRNKSTLGIQTTDSIVYKTLWGRLSQQKSWTGMLLNRRKHGELYLAEVTIAPVITEQGVTTHLLGMHRDVTKTHNLEQQLRNQKALIDSVVDATPVVTVLLDENQEVVLCNRAYRDLSTELNHNKLVSLFIAQLLDAMGMTIDEVRRKRQGFHGLEVSIDFGDRDRVRWFSCSGNWINEHASGVDTYFQFKQQIYLLLVANEVTFHKRQQNNEKVAALRALMAEQELVDSMRETVSAAIYQLQGPVNMVEAALGILQRRALVNAEISPLSDALKQALTAGHEALNTLRASMPAMLSEAFIPVNVNELLRDVLGVSTNRLLSCGVVVEWRPASVLPSVIAPAGRIRGMFKQLIDNAIEAMDYPGLAMRELRISTFEEVDAIRIDVTDTGPGIPPELRFKVFEPFFTTKSHRRGGMGLALVQEVLNAIGGTIYIDPDYTDGSRISVRLLRHIPTEIP